MNSSEKLSSGWLDGYARAQAPAERDYCFTAGTKIATLTGSKHIERVQIGDRVWSFDTEKEQIVEGRVSEVFAKKDYPNGAVVLADGRALHSSPDHPFFRERTMSVVASTPYREETSRLEVALAEHLVPGDVVFVLDGKQLKSAEVASTSFDADLATVYNFTVEGTHSYFAEGVLVHNKE